MPQFRSVTVQFLFLLADLNSQGELLKRAAWAVGVSEVSKVWRKSLGCWCSAKRSFYLLSDRGVGFYSLSRFCRCWRECYNLYGRGLRLLRTIGSWLQHKHDRHSSKPANLRWWYCPSCYVEVWLVKSRGTFEDIIWGRKRGEIYYFPSFSEKKITYE